MAKKKSSMNIVYWIAIIVIFYFLTSAAVSSGIAEVQKKFKHEQTVPETFVVEKTVTSTKYRTEKVPFGTPRCEQFTFNFSKTYAYSEGVINGQKTATCTFIVKNEEDMVGVFKFYPNYLKTGKINDGPIIERKIEPFSTAKFEWNFTLEPTETANCLLQCSDCPKRMKCFYLEPITYQIKQVPYNVEEKKNVTDTRYIVKEVESLIKVNETQNTYTNRYFGYVQFFYFGY